MSLLPGLISGSLVAGGIYYALFSFDLQSRTAAHKRELRLLSERLQEPRIEAPPSAAARVLHHPRKEYLRQRWNEEVGSLINTIRHWDHKLVQLGRSFIGHKDD